MGTVSASIGIDPDDVIEHNGDIAVGFVTINGTDTCLHIRNAVAAENLLRAVWAARAALHHEAQESTADPAADLVGADPF